MGASRFFVALSLIVGLIGWIIHALIDALVRGERSFLDSLLLDLPPGALYERLAVLLLFLALGVAVASIVSSSKWQRRSERRVLDRLTDGILSIGDDLRITWANQALCGMLGRKVDDLVGTSVLDLCTAGSREVIRSLVRGDTRQRALAQEIALINSEGSEVPVLLRRASAEFSDTSGDRWLVALGISDDVWTVDLDRRIEEIFGAMVEATRDIALVVAPDGTVIAANRLAAEELGGEGEQIVGRCAYELMPDDLARSRRERLEEVVRTRRSVTFEDQNRGRNLDHDIYPIFGENAEVVCVAIIVRDVTEYTEAKEALVRSEERYRSLFESTGTAMCMVEDDGTISLVNEQFVQLSGYEREQIEGRLTYRDLIAPHEQERMGTYHRQRREVDGEVPDAYEFDFVPRDGTVRRILLNINLISGTKTSVASLLDITELRRTEQALRDQAQIIEQTHDIILITDLEGNIVDANRAEEEALGIPREELLQSTVFDLSDDPDSQQQILDTAAATGEWHGEVVNRTADGGERLLDCRVFVLNDEQGNASRLAGISRDITERRAAERQTERALAERQMIMDAMSEFVTLQDLEHRVQLVNRAAAGSVGLEPEQIIGRRCYEFWGDGNQPCEGCPRQETLRTGQRAVGEHSTPDGREWEISFDPVFENDEMVGLVEVARDITERKRQEREVVQLNQFRESVIDQANIWVQVIDREGRVVLWNRAAEEISGYSRDEVIGSSDIWEKLYPEPEYRRRLMAGRRRIIEEGLAVENEELPVRTVEGRDRIISWNSRRLLDANGEPIGSVSVGRDVTRWRELEAQLQQSAKMEAIGRLAGGVAHDFNNMLTVILGNAQLLSGRCVGNDRGLLEEIRVAANRSADLVGQLLAFSRRQVLDPEVLDLNEIAAEMQPMLNRMIGEKVEILFTRAPDPVPIEADVSQMQQVLMNLVVNARDALPDGGTISIDTASLVLDDDYASQHASIEAGRYAMLAVSDTGIGMDEETISYIFEPFFTTRADDGGVGLGLATVYGIVAQSGGHVTVYSEPQRGTVFKVYLPMIEDRLPTHRQKQKEPEAGQIDATILVVEDEVAVSRMIVRALESSGCEVLAAEHGADALDILADPDLQIDMLVTDVVMPGMSGPELAESVAEENPDLPILFLSGYTDSALSSNGILDGPRNYLQKPFSAQELLRRVRRLLAQES